MSIIMYNNENNMAMKIMKIMWKKKRTWKEIMK